MKTKFLACCNLNEEERLQSSSGGVFSLLAHDVIKNKGAVYGASFTDDYSVEHIGITRDEDISKLVGSKYAFSKLNNTFIEIESRVKFGETVLFCGTPCQVAGLDSYLGEKYDNLIMIDFICHGTPELSIWKQYLFERRSDRIVKNVNFRDKRNGWIDYSLVIDYDDGTNYVSDHSKDPYMKSFLSNIILRDACYKCENKGVENRKSDITLGDLWNAEKLAPQMFDNKGTSFVMIHSEKGMDLFNRIKDRLDFEKVDSQSALAANPSAFRPSKYNPLRNLFLKDLLKGRGLIETMNKYTDESILKRCLFKLYKMINGLQITSPSNPPSRNATTGSTATVLSRKHY